jgi:hypothetical protein
MTQTDPPSAHMDLETDIEAHTTPTSALPSKSKTKKSDTKNKKKSTTTAAAAAKTKKKISSSLSSPSTFVDIPLGYDASERTEIGSISDERTKSGSVVLSSSEDPFAKRTGKTLIWRDVQMTLVRIIIYRCYNTAI